MAESGLRKAQLKSAKPMRHIDYSVMVVRE
jgi:hypothetical protein